MKRESYLAGSTKTCPAADKYSPGRTEIPKKIKREKRRVTIDTKSWCIK
jgi:hypothetical protein